AVSKSFMIRKCRGHSFCDQLLNSSSCHWGRAAAAATVLAATDVLFGGILF
ncbi:hypothetical protein Tco_1305096, partial [Tanacetum coccineum]